MGFVAKPHGNSSDLALFRAIFGPFQHLKTPRTIKITSVNFANKMILIEVQIHSASKITHLQVHCTDFYH